jgi:peptidoglycan/xylan/chitin deacetylase (PgdA/CDA1 family)
VRVFLTVDIDVYYSGDFDLEARGYGKGVDHIIAVANDHGVPVTFFVDIMGATRWGVKPVRELCRYIQSEGHEVQMHLHPVVAQIDNFTDQQDTFWREDLATQTRLIRIGMEMFDACGVENVVAFRAGALAANVDSLRAMQANNLYMSSNRDLDQKSSIASQLNDHFAVRNDAAAWEGIVDLPVNVLRSPIPWADGPCRHLEICALGSLEMKDALRRMAGAGYAAATILTHPREFFYRTRSGTAYIQKNCRRLESLIRLLGNDSSLSACPISAWKRDDALPMVSPPELRLHPLHSLMRLIGQIEYRVRRKFFLNPQPFDPVKVEA